MNEVVWSPAQAGRWQVPGGTPHPAALQSVLVLGGLVPGLGPYGWHPERDQMATRAATQTALDAVGEVFGHPDEVRRMATSALDTELERALAGGRKPLLLFSGGVDSSLMAARLLQLGRDDVRLLHYGFRENDPETAVAHQIAEQLGLAMDVVRRTPGAVVDCLTDTGLTYPVPFGDQSAPPTAELCAAVAARVDPGEYVVIDGTGADGAFGLGGRATGIAGMLRRLPRPALAVGSEVYRRAVWRMTGPVEHRGRAVRRLATFEPGFAAIAQNSLYGTLYDAPEVAGLEAGWHADLSGFGASAVVPQVVLTDLAITCAAIFAQKTWGPLSTAGFDVAYPFLSPTLGALGIKYTTAHPDTVPKAWMKEELCRHVDRDLVYRPKSGFIDPERELFDAPGFREALGDALAPDGVGHELIRARTLERFLVRHGSLAVLPHGHQNLLWAIAFTDRWYRSVPGSLGT